MGAGVTVAAAVAWMLSGSTPSADQRVTAVAGLLELTSGSEAGLSDGHEALALCKQWLGAAEQSLDQVDTMTAVFHKRERVDGSLQDLNVMDLKVRKEPLAVYLRWREPDEGREVIWQEGSHDGQMVVHPGGWRGKLMPKLLIDPEGERAMQFSRRPVSSIGLWNFARRLRAFVEEEVDLARMQVELRDDTRIAGRDCHRFGVVCPEPLEGVDFHRVAIYIDRELGLPVAFELYGWEVDPATGEPVLEESYAFHDLELGARLTRVDFDTTNASYQFGG